MFWFFIGLIVFILLLYVVKAYREEKWNVDVLKDVYEDIKTFYEKKLAWNTKFKFKHILWAKLGIFVFIFVVSFGIQFSNLGIYKDQIMNDVVYKTDLQYSIDVEEGQEEQIFEEQMYFFEKAKKNITKERILTSAIEDISFEIEGMIISSDRNTILDDKTLANAVYHRLYDLYVYQQYDILQFAAIAFLLTSITEIVVLVRKSYNRAIEERRITFLKQLIIIEGSVEPVDIDKLIGRLIENSTGDMNRYLKEIRNKKKINTLKSSDIYKDIIEREKRTEYKLFFEKLDQADNFDFQQAVRNIEGDFKQSRDDLERETNKKSEQIRTLGMSGFLIIFVYCVVYLLIPWMGLLNFDSLTGL